MAASDKRLALATEVISSIKIVKFFSWERNFLVKMDETRRVELNALLRRTAFSVIGGVVMMTVPIFVSVITFGVHTKVLHQPLTAEKAFTALALFNVLKHPFDLLVDVSSFALHRVPVGC